VPAYWLCRNAGARASLNERTADRDAVDGVAEAEAACVPENAQGEGSWQRGEAPVTCRRGGSLAEGILAGEVLRFQCQHDWEEERETELHARESCGSRVGGAS